MHDEQDISKHGEHNATKSETIVADAASDNARADTNSTSEAELTAEEQIAELKAVIARHDDDKLRSAAEMQNMQKRNQEEIKKSRDYAISSFAKDLVSVKDHLEMALQDQSGNFEMLKMGVDLTLKQLIQIFENHKIKVIDPKTGDKLDPHSHQAIDTIENSGQAANTIVAVKQKGYILSERVLRPAMVTVAK